MDSFFSIYGHILLVSYPWRHSQSPRGKHQTIGKQLINFARNIQQWWLVVMSALLFPLKAPISQFNLNKTDLHVIYFFCKVFINVIYSQIAFSRFGVYLKEFKLILISLCQITKRLTLLLSVESISLKIYKIYCFKILHWSLISIIYSNFIYCLWPLLW